MPVNGFERKKCQRPGSGVQNTLVPVPVCAEVHLQETAIKSSDRGSLRLNYCKIIHHYGSNAFKMLIRHALVLTLLCTSNHSSRLRQICSTILFTTMTTINKPFLDSQIHLKLILNALSLKVRSITICSFCFLWWKMLAVNKTRCSTNWEWSLINDFVYYLLEETTMKSSDYRIKGENNVLLVQMLATRRRSGNIACNYEH